MTESLRELSAAYDTVADSYAELVDGLDPEAGLERAMLTEFVEIVTVKPAPAVLDAGCGPGRIGALLAARGCRPIGVDLSPRMVRLARNVLPSAPLAAGDLADLPIRTGSCDGVLAWYSIIHTRPEVLPRVLSEFRRVVRPGGPVLLGFQSGDGPRTISNPYGHDLEMAAHLHRAESVADLLAEAGFVEQARLVRAPGPRERSPQAFLLASAGV